MSGDKQLGDGHAHWHSAEESLTPNGMSCRKYHTLNNNFNYYIPQYDTEKHENGRGQVTNENGRVPYSQSGHQLHC